MKEIIQKYISTYFLKAESGKTRIYLYYPYLPFRKTNIEYAKIDAYYLASNTLYHIVQNLAKELSAYSAHVPLLNIKQEFLDAGFAIPLRNSLVAIPPYGSRVALSILEVNGEFTKDENNITKSTFSCNNCTICQKLCPTKALDGGFCRSNCLRNMQDGTAASLTQARLMEKRILGCDICQSKCPHNSALTQDIPSDLLEILYLPTLVTLLQKSRKDLIVLEKYIGKNMVRCKKLLYYTILALDDSLLYLLDSIVTSDIDIKRAIEELKKDKETRLK